MKRASGPRGKLLRFKPENMDWVEELPHYVEKLENAGWFTMCERI